MFDHIIDKAADYGLGLAFNFWVWLGKALKLEINLPGETLRLIEEVIEDNLRLKDEIKALKAEIASYPPYAKQDNRPKLTKAEVENIRALSRSGYSRRKIAAIYDVNPTTVSRIVRGQYHKTIQAV